MDSIKYSLSGESGHEVSEEIRALYADSLADYRRVLSEASDSFSAAKAATEEAAQNGTRVPDAVIEQLETSERLLAQTVVSLGALTALWAGVGKEILPFEDQQQFTVIATEEVRSVRLKLLRAAAEGLLWESLQPGTEFARSLGEAAWTISRVRMFRRNLSGVVA